MLDLYNFSSLSSRRFYSRYPKVEITKVENHKCMTSKEARYTLEVAIETVRYLRYDLVKCKK